jgi:hypothetical protein
MVQTPFISMQTLGLTAAVAILSACAAPYPLHSNMTDDQIEARLAENFAPGMTQPEVSSKLDELRVPSRYRLDYPRTDSRPEVLLARLYPPGGFWVTHEDDLIKFVDVSFVFDAAAPPKLVRFPIFRDGVRYFQHEPVYGPTRKPIRPIQPYPASPPPPADPLEGVP